MAQDTQFLSKLPPKEIEGSQKEAGQNGKPILEDKAPTTSTPGLSLREG